MNPATHLADEHLIAENETRWMEPRHYTSNRYLRLPNSFKAAGEIENICVNWTYDSPANNH